MELEWIAVMLCVLGETREGGKRELGVMSLCRIYRLIEDRSRRSETEGYLSVHPSSTILTLFLSSWWSGVR